MVGAARVASEIPLPAYTRVTGQSADWTVRLIVARNTIIDTNDNGIEILRYTETAKTGAAVSATYLIVLRHVVVAQDIALTIGEFDPAARVHGSEARHGSFHASRTSRVRRSRCRR